MHIYAVLDANFSMWTKRHPYPLITDFWNICKIARQANAFSEVTQNSQKFLCLRDTDCDKDHDR